ncbi:MAG: hypothetical protein ABF289_02440 [Clostridiales bacterium]
MAKISKIRFINFTYNENRHIYDQTFDFYNGENTLMNLQNGGGKTVLVQMMMQPIIPKQKLKDRIFKNYFKNIKAPVYIMIEWILDKTNKKVLTGIGIKKVIGRNLDDPSENLRIITFASEYEKESEFDISNINLLEENLGIVKLIEFEKVVKNMSLGEKEGKGIKLFRWELPEDKKEYSRILQSYKINQIEWKNLMVKINESEAGLNSFFNDCKTNKNLIKKWFLPTIEEQLNKDGSTVENIREIIKNHAEQIVKNEGMIKEKEIFESFKNNTIELVTKLEEYQSLSESIIKREFELGNVNVFLIEKLKTMENNKIELNEKIKQIEISLQELEYERYSFEYHEINDELLSMKNNLLEISDEIRKFDEKIEDYNKEKSVLMCSKLNNEIKDINSKISKFESELERENLKQEDVRTKLNDIEYSLKVMYGENLTRLKSTLKRERDMINSNKDENLKNIKEKEKIKVELNKLGNDISNLKGKINLFNEMEKNTNKRYSDLNLVRNISTLEYSNEEINNLKNRLDHEEEALYAIIKRVESDLVKKEEDINSFNKNIEELSAKNSKIIIESNRNESMYKTFEEEREVVIKILNFHGLNELEIFNKSKIVNILNTEIDKYKKLVNEKTLENSILKNQLDVYKSGKTIEVSNDLKKIFEDNNIFIEFGYEWLRNYSNNRSVKIKLLKNNPFIPYSIIISKEDLKELQTKDIDTFTSIAVPVIVKETLEDELDINRDNSIYSIGNTKFLMSFNEKLLNKNYLKEITQEIQTKMENNNEIIKNARESEKSIEINLVKIENFKYKKEDINKLEKVIKNNIEKLEKNKNKINEIKDNIELENENKQKLLKELKGLESENSNLKRKKEDSLELLNLYKKYLESLKLKREKDDRYNLLNTSYIQLEDKIVNIKDTINNLALNITGISNNIQKCDKEYTKYKDVKKGNILYEGIESLESKRAVFISTISGKIQNLKSILEDYKDRREDKLKEINEYNLDESEYFEKEFSEYRLKELKDFISKLEKNKHQTIEDRNKLNFEIAEKKSDEKHILKTIKDNLGRDEAKPKEYLRDIDYVKKKDEYKLILKETEKAISKCKQKIQNLNKVKFRVEEYEIFMERVKEIEYIDSEDLEVYSKDIARDYKKLKLKENDLKALLVTLYSNVENDFTQKAEVFKNLFKNILDNERRYVASHALNAFSRTYMQIERKLEQHSVDIKKIDDMEKCIIDNTLGYLKNVYDELNNIDKNSTIEIEGKRRKMLMINLPEKDKLEDLSLKGYLKNTIENCVNLYKESKSMDGLLLNDINTYDLFDRYVSINKIQIILLKIELNKVKKKTWRQVIEENSGGERFVSAFVVFISLLTYMRGENMLGINNETKVLIMDNPFGPITSEHLLKPLFEIAKKYNTQLICLTDLKEHTIFDRFNLIYSINIEREIGRDEEYIEIKTIKKELEKEDKEDEIISVSMFKLEEKSRFHLAN